MNNHTFDTVEYWKERALEAEKLLFEARSELYRNSSLLEYAKESLAIQERLLTEKEGLISHMRKAASSQQREAGVHGQSVI